MAENKHGNKNSEHTPSDIRNTLDQSTTVMEKYKKEKWNNSLEFLMSCVAMSVGLGNIWRFPFTAYQNGGGAFLIPYVIILILVGRPLYYLEMCIGQFTSKGNVNSLEALATVLKGVGYCQTLGAVYIATYYCSLLAITIFYFMNSFTNKLPWSYCRPEWEKENALKNITCLSSASTQTTNKNSLSSSELYFSSRREVLKEKESINDGIGYPDWKLTLCLGSAWLISFVIMRKGIKSSGKASYFLALFPYIILLTLLIRAATLDGSSNGIFYFINPNWTKIVDPQVWYSAATQCFFSLNVGFGNIISYASYNSFTHNIYRDSVIISIIDTFTSLIAGFTIFGILGNLAFKLNVNVDEVINSGGAGLAFISYPEAIAKFDTVPWLFALLFFLMLFIIGMGSLISMEGNVYTVISETYPHLKGWKVSLSIVLVGFLVSLVYITPGGQYILNLVDHYGASMTCFIANIVVVCLISWFYGFRLFLDDMGYMLKRKHGIYWRLSWGFLTPAVLVTILLYFLITMTNLQHEGKAYPNIALVFGWLITGLAVGQIPIWMIVTCIQNRNTGIKQLVLQSLQFENWRPANLEDFDGWKIMKKEKLLELKQKRFREKLRYAITGKF